MSLESLLSRMNELQKTNKLELKVAVSMLAVTADRIFEQGKDAKDSEIGRYSKEYLKQRVKKNYPSSTKVILQATKQLIDDWHVIPNQNSIGLGFINQTNANKSGWVEETYDKSIFEHTPKELKSIELKFNQGVKKIING